MLILREARTSLSCSAHRTRWQWSECDSAVATEKGLFNQSALMISITSTAVLWYSIVKKTIKITLTRKYIYSCIEVSPCPPPLPLPSPPHQLSSPSFSNHPPFPSSSHPHFLPPPCSLLHLTFLHSNLPLFPHLPRLSPLPLPLPQKTSLPRATPWRPDREH